MVCATKRSTLPHVTKLLGQTVPNPALICALLHCLLLAWLLEACLQPKLLLVCRGRTKGAITWDGAGRCVCKAFGELPPVLCFLHRISSPLVPKIACGRAGWSSCMDYSDSPLHHCCSHWFVQCSPAWASVNCLLRQNGLDEGLQICAPLNSSLLTFIGVT